MNQITDVDQGVVRRVDWQELIPPTLLLRAFSATFKSSFLILGAILIALVGWTLGFRPEGGVETGMHCSQAFRFTFDRIDWIEANRPWCLPTLLGAVLVGAWFALALSRTTVVKLTSSARSTIFASALFALKKFRSIVLPALLPIAFGACALGVMIATDKLGAFGEICSPFLLLCLFVLGTFGAIVSMAFPLAVTAVAADNSDCFDAVTRGVSYVVQRLLFLAIYWFFGAILTLVGLVFVEALAQFCFACYGEVYVESQSSWVSFWRLTILATPIAYCFNSAVVYTNGIYLMLRRSVDGTAYDSCVLEFGKRKPRQLREIVLDAKGAPEFADANKTESSKTSAIDEKEAQS